MQQSGQIPPNPYLRGNRGHDRKLMITDAQTPDRAASHASDGFNPRRYLAPLVGAGDRRRRAIHVRRRCFIVNVAIPTIAVELHTSSAQIEAVIAIYLIAMRRGGHRRPARRYPRHQERLHRGRVRIYVDVAVVRAGAIRSGIDPARLAQGATAAMMVPQVLATLHLLFSDASRGRAFGIYGVVLGLGGCGRLHARRRLVTLDIAGLGWRAVFFVNVPFGLIIVAAALKIMPKVPRRAGTRLDIPGAIVLFAGLLCLIGPLLFGHDVRVVAVGLVHHGGGCQRSCRHSCGSSARSQAVAACR